jgi:Mg-chelatase subunit ChlD
MPKTPGTPGISPEQKQAQAEAEKQERLKKEIERWKDLFLSQIHTVTLDRTIRIKAIPPGEKAPGAWFYAPSEHTIYFSVEELFERIEKYGEEHVLSIMSHEAAHAVISDFSVVPETVLDREVGLLSTLHATEERPTDFLVRYRAPVAHDWLCDMRRALMSEGGESRMTHDEIKIMQGYYPRFGDLATIIVFDPYTDEAFDEASPEAQDAYEEIEKAMHDIERMVPKDEDRFPKERKLALARKRYGAVYREILPHVRELVEYDRDSGRMHEAAKRILAGILMQHEVASAIPGSLTVSGDDAIGEMLKILFAPEAAVAMGDEELLSPDLEAELLEKMKAAATRKAEFLEKIKKEASEEQVEEDTEAETEKEIKEDDATPVIVEVDTEDKELYLASIAGILDRIGGTAHAPLPVDDLSPELQDRLLELYDQFNEQMRKMIEKIVKKGMKEMDEKIGKGFQQDTGGKPMDTSGGAGEGQGEGGDGGNEGKGSTEEDPDTAEKKEKRKKKQTDKEIEEIERRVAEMERADKYQQVYKEVNEQIERLTQRLYEIFHPRTPQQARLRKTGSNPNLPAVFKRTAARRAGAAVVEDRIFEVKEVPKVEDNVIGLLVDASASMAGTPMKKTFKAVVMIVEALNKLGIKCFVDYFPNNQRIDLKNIEETLSDPIRDRLLALLHPEGWNTPMSRALVRARQQMQQTTAENKFLIVLTDGSPDSKTTTKQQIELAAQEGCSPIGVGMGPHSGSVKELFPASLADVPFEELPDVLAALIQDALEFPEKYQVTT